MKRRIFVALLISEYLQEEARAFQKKYTCLPVRWLAGKNLHVTLVPPWYEDDTESVIEKLKTCEGSTGAFDVSFFAVTYGPTLREPRLLWAEGETPKQLCVLKECAEHCLGMKPEKRLFKLHLTLARFRPETFSSFPIKTLDEKISWRQTSDSFVLMESHLSRTGADYETIASFLFTNS